MATDLPAAVCLKCGAEVHAGDRFCSECGFSRVGPRADPLIGLTLLDQFRVVRQIGRGGWANVYAADQPAMGREVAVKVLHKEFAGEDEPVQRFYREARAATRLQHPNILRPWMVGELEDGTPFLIMDLVDGVTLGDELKRVGRLSVERVIRIATQICSALEEAADQGVVHRDLKPANVFLTSQGRREDVVKIADFGIAKVLDEGDAAAPLTHTGDILGTPAYMSPEQALGRGVDHRSDLYALGALIYRMVTGRTPFKEETIMALLAAQVSKHAPPMSEVAPEVDLPQGMETLVRTLMAKNARDRPHDVEDVTEALHRMARRLGSAGSDEPLGEGGEPTIASGPPPGPEPVSLGPASQGPGGTRIHITPAEDTKLDIVPIPDEPDVVDKPVAPTAAWTEPVVGREWPTVHRKVGGEVALGAVRDLADLAERTRASGGPMPIAGSGACGHSGDGGQALGAALCRPAAIAQDVHGNLFVVDRGNHCIRFVDARQGVIQTVAGTAEEPGFGGDDGPADVALLEDPSDIVVDASGNLYVADTGNRRVRAIDVRSGHMGTVVGSGRSSPAAEGVPAHLGGLAPSALAISQDGALFIADADNHRVWRVDPEAGTLRTAVGTGAPSVGGEGGPAERACLNAPQGLAFAPDGALYVADTGNARVCRIDPGCGTLTVVAGGDDGALGTPVGVTTTREGELRVVDSTGGRVLAVDPVGGAVRVVASELLDPRGLAVDGQGAVYVAETGRHRVWAVLEPD